MAHFARRQLRIIVHHCSNASQYGVHSSAFAVHHAPASVATDPLGIIIASGHASINSLCPLGHHPRQTSAHAFHKRRIQLARFFALQQMCFNSMRAQFFRAARRIWIWIRASVHHARHARVLQRVNARRCATNMRARFQRHNRRGAAGLCASAFQRLHLGVSAANLAVISPAHHILFGVHNHATHHGIWLHISMPTHRQSRRNF